MIGSDVIRGYCDTILLCLLAQGDSYGYELSRAIREKSGGAYEMKETTLYSAFARLEKRGFIASYQGQESRGRPRTYYTITAPGREYLLKNELDHPAPAAGPEGWPCFHGRQGPGSAHFNSSHIRTMVTTDCSRV